MNELVFTAPPALAAQVTPGMTLEVSVPGGSFTATVTGSAADVRQQGGVAVIRATPVDASLPPAGSRSRPWWSPKARTVRSASRPMQCRRLMAAGGVCRRRRWLQGAAGLAGRRAGDRIEILAGLTGSERIVGANAFLLKAELAKGEAEHGH